MNTLVDVGLRVGETLDLTGFTTKETVKIGSDLIGLALAESVTLCASCLKFAAERQRAIRGKDDVCTIRLGLLGIGFDELRCRKRGRRENRYSL